MKKSIFYIFITVILGILNSCMPEDIPVTPFNRGDAVISQVVLEKDYRWLVFFNLNENKALNRTLMTDWDLSFNCSDTSNIIMLNMATYMALIDKGAVSFESVTSSEDSTWKGENPYGYENVDSSAIGVWYEKDGDKIVSKNHVYLLDRGTNWVGKPLGFRKMMILGADKLGFDIRIANLDGSKDRSIRINKNPALNYISLSFVNDEVKEIEPPTVDWDIVFTKYTYSYYIPDYIPYSVTGVLLNPKYTAAAIDTIRTFEEITKDLIDTYTLSNRLDAIGFDWKIVDINTGVYTIFPWKNYIIRDRLGFYYKLHFIDYYDDLGGKGSPKFEFQKL